MDKFVSIIITHWTQNNVRSAVMRKSLTSLVENTKYPYELIIIDNGENEEDSKFLRDLKPNVYIRNEHNMHFGYARNQGVKLSQGDYICIADNDIIYSEGWLKECVKVLEVFPDKKIYGTPIEYPTPVMKDRYDRGELEHDGKAYNLSMRAGSNCFVCRREDFFEIGLFSAHRIAGSRWTDSAVRAGYLAAVVPGKMITDEGLREGYSLGKSIPIRLHVRNGKDIYFNSDEYRKENIEGPYKEQL